MRRSGLSDLANQNDEPPTVADISKILQSIERIPRSALNTVPITQAIQRSTVSIMDALLANGGAIDTANLATLAQLASDLSTILAAIAPLATTSQQTSNMSTIIAAIATAVAPLATTSQQASNTSTIIAAVASAVAPLATSSQETTNTNSVIAAVASAVAPLATSSQETTNTNSILSSIASVATTANSTDSIVASGTFGNQAMMTVINAIAAELNIGTGTMALYSELTNAQMSSFYSSGFQTEPPTFQVLAGNGGTYFTVGPSVCEITASGSHTFVVTAVLQVKSTLVSNSLTVRVTKGGSTVSTQSGITLNNSTFTQINVYSVFSATSTQAIAITFQPTSNDTLLMGVGSSITFGSY